MSKCTVLSNMPHCCCKCKYQRAIYKHPCNKADIVKGSILEPMGFICDIEGEDHLIFSEEEHSLCEEFTKKD